MSFALLLLAGAAGAAARYGVNLATQGWGGGLPFGTLAVNVLGSFLLAFVVALSLRGVVSPEARLVLGTGFCGAFTTFSALELETHDLISRGQWAAGSAYVLASLVLGFAAILAGRALAATVAPAA